MNLTYASTLIYITALEELWSVQPLDNSSLKTIKDRLLILHMEVSGVSMPFILSVSEAHRRFMTSGSVISMKNIDASSRWTTPHHVLRLIRRAL